MFLCMLFDIQFSYFHCIYTQDKNCWVTLLALVDNVRAQKKYERQ